eukprot:scaffold8921_cov137-Isochrysis_galbana.AAC.2
MSCVDSEKEPGACASCERRDWISARRLSSSSPPLSTSSSPLSSSSPSPSSSLSKSSSSTSSSPIGTSSRDGTMAAAAMPVGYD